jgi:serine/threonine protein phosphatase PrpC
LTDVSGATIRPAGPGTAIGRYTVVESRSHDDVVARADGGGEVILATGATEPIDHEARALAALEDRHASARVLELGDDPIAGAWLALTPPPEGAIGFAAWLEDAPPAGIFAVLDQLLDLVAALEDAHLEPSPRVEDLWIRAPASTTPTLWLQRVRGTTALDPGSRIDARAVLEELGPTLAYRSLAVIPPALLHAVLPSREGAARGSTIEAVRKDIARARASVGATNPARARCAGLSDVGLLRERNEDAVSIAHEGERAVLVVCDGISASYRADLAARIAAATIAEHLAVADHRGMSGAVASSIRDAHVAICAEHHTLGGEPLGTTAVAALRVGRKLAVGWVGDSRAYWLDADGSAQLLTRDHSWLNDVLATGMATLDEAIASPYAHALTRCLGPLEGGDPSTQAEPDAIEVEIGAGTLILCSDGLWNYYPAAEDIAGLCALAGHRPSAEVLARALVNGALARGGQDNVTVAVLIVE